LKPARGLEDWFNCRGYGWMGLDVNEEGSAEPLR
jgi:hypothetical protein